MGVNFLGFNIPTSAAELGVDTRNDAAETAKTIAAPFYNGGQAIGSGVADFVHGLVTGHALATHAAAPAPAPAPATSSGKGSAKSAPNAPVDLMTAFLAAQTARQMQPGYGSDGGGPQSPLDIVRNAAVASGGLSLNQLGALSEAVSRVNPPLAPKQHTYRDDAAQAALALAEQQGQAAMAAAKAGNDPVAYRKATDDLFQKYRTLAASPNPMFDINSALGGQPAGN